MPNTNCLKGMQCPACESYEPIFIDASATFKVFDSGTDEFYEVEWEDMSRAWCLCGFRGTVKDFQVKKERKVINKRKKKGKKS